MLGNPPQHQSQQPGKESDMHPRPESAPDANQDKKMMDKVAIITGGDSGIGKAVSLLFARHGANCTIVYLNENDDAKQTQEEIESFGRKALLISGDLGDKSFCKKVISDTIEHFGRLDVLVNNAAEQHPRSSVTDISEEQLLKTFRTNLFAYFYMVQESLPHMSEGATIINTTSVTAYRGSDHLVDYSATKGAIVSFTRSLSAQLASKNIRVNAVAPGPIWTPLIPSTFDSQHVKDFGKDTPLGRAGQPSEIAPSYLFLATTDSSYMTGQVLHPNGGEIVNT